MGGFLTEFYKLLSSRLDEALEIDAAQLTNASFYGYDINPSNATRTKTNMYLAEEGVSDVERRDSLAEADTDECYEIGKIEKGDNKIVFKNRMNWLKV